MFQKILAATILLTPGLLWSAPQPLRIMPLGDSLTQASPGYRAPLAEALTKAGYKFEMIGSSISDPKLDTHTNHEGHGGFTIGPGKSKADEWANGKGNLFDNLEQWLAPKPDLILLLIGTNDFFITADLQPGYDPNVHGPARLGALLDKIHSLSPASRIVVASIPPVEWDENFAKGYNAAIPALVAARPYTTFADLRKMIGFVAGDWTADKLHPSDLGYQKMAKAWFEVITPLMEKNR